MFSCLHLEQTRLGVEILVIFSHDFLSNTAQFEIVDDSSTQSIKQTFLL